MSFKKNTIYFIGPMGAGKSTIGRLLAQEIGWPFLDMDREIEARSGVSMTWIFDREGEMGFRRREIALLQEIGEQCERRVVATGGGVVIFPESREILKKSGVVIFLETSVDTQVKRTLKDKRRPLLQSGVDRRQILADLYQKRIMLYHSTADIVINADAGIQELVVRKLCALLSKKKIL